MEDVNDSLRITSEKTEALKNAKDYLSYLPHLRAKAIVRSLHFLESSGQKTHFSLYDMLESFTPIPHPAREGEKTDSSSKILWQKFSEKYPEIFEKDHCKELKKKVDQNTDSPDQTSIDVPQDHKERFTLREINQVFDVRGSIVIPLDKITVFPGQTGDGKDSLRSFFNHNRRYGNFDDKTGSVDLRGLDYLVAADSSKSMFRKFETIQSALEDGIDLLGKIDRKNINSPGEYLLYLGMLDYLKSDSMLLFHTLTYDERQLIVRSGEDNERYQSFRNRSQQMMETFTRMYYQTLLGLDYDQELGLDSIRSEVEPLITFTRQDIGKSVFGDQYIDDYEALHAVPRHKELLNQINIDRFKTPDVQHPLVTALGAQEAVMKYPNTNAVVGIPTGGTEVAILSKLLYQVIKNSNPHCCYVPLSIHSGIKIDEQDFKTYIGRNCGDTFVDKNILLVDDNSPTGLTFEFVRNTLMTYGAKSVNYHVVEFDPTRLLRNNSQDNTRFRLTSPAETTLGITSVNKVGGYAVQEDTRKMLGERKLFSRAAKPKPDSTS